MNTPNKITLSRLLLLPIIIFFYLAEFVPYGRLVAAIVFVAACLTDFLDGYIARKNNQVTTLGKFFDTIADKVLIMVGLILITAGQIHGLSPVVYPSELGIACVVVILAREFIVSALRQIAASKGVVLAADMGGKIKATAQYIVTSLYMFLAFFETSIAPFLNPNSMNTVIPIIRFILMILLAGTALLTIYTGASYLIRNRHVFSEDKEVDEIVKEIEEEKNEVTAEVNKNIDPLLPQALDICIDNGFASTTLIQRKLAIGYPRAARIIDQMEELGYISEPNEEHKREVKISKEELKKIYGDNFR